MADATNSTSNKRAWRSRLWIVMAVLVLVTGGTGGYFAWRYYVGARTGAAGAPETADTAGSSQNQAESASNGEAKSTLSLEPFLVNLADAQSARFVKVTFQLGLTEDKEEFTKSPVAIAATRDAIITLLSSKTSDQILTVEGKNKLRQEVRERVNDVISGSKARVQDVYIVEFVVQL
jgi:flagellar FliL protein